MKITLAAGSLKDGGRRGCRVASRHGARDAHMDHSLAPARIELSRIPRVALRHFMIRKVSLYAWEPVCMLCVTIVRITLRILGNI